MSTDGELIAAWREGDGEAGDALMQRYYQPVLRFFELKATWAADDLTQKTLLALVERPDRPEAAASFRTYLFGIARNQLLMHLRHLSRTDTMTRFQKATSGQRRTGISTLVARNDEQRLLLRALAMLPTDLQIAVGLYYWENMSTVEVAEVLEIPVSTLRSRMGRARQLLREQLAAIAEVPEAGQAIADDLEQWTRSLALLAP